MVTCGFCEHPGIHVNVLPASGGVTRCKDCPQCFPRQKQESGKRPGSKSDPPSH